MKDGLKDFVDKKERNPIPLYMQDVTSAVFK